jgi:hypothetical protein
MALSRRPAARHSYRLSVFNCRKASRRAATALNAADKYFAGAGEGNDGDKAVLFLCVVTRSLISHVGNEGARSQEVNAEIGSSRTFLRHRI